MYHPKNLSSDVIPTNRSVIKDQVTISLKCYIALLRKYDRLMMAANSLLFFPLKNAVSSLLVESELASVTCECDGGDATYVWGSFRRFVPCWGFTPKIQMQ